MRAGPCLAVTWTQPCQLQRRLVPPEKMLAARRGPHHDATFPLTSMLSRGPQAAREICARVTAFQRQWMVVCTFLAKKTCPQSGRWGKCKTYPHVLHRSDCNKSLTSESLNPPLASVPALWLSPSPLFAVHSHCPWRALPRQEHALLQQARGGSRPRRHEIHLQQASWAPIAERSQRGSYKEGMAQWLPTH